MKNTSFFFWERLGQGYHNTGPCYMYVSGLHSLNNKDNVLHSNDIIPLHRIPLLASTPQCLSALGMWLNLHARVMRDRFFPLTFWGAGFLSSRVGWLRGRAVLLVLDVEQQVRLLLQNRAEADLRHLHEGGRGRGTFYIQFLIKQHPNYKKKLGNKAENLPLQNE